MKNSIKLLLAFLFLAAGCSKSEVDLLFDKTPEQRMGEQQKEIKDQLVSAQFGWKVFNETLSRGNYGYYMSFDDKDRVKMLSDINNGSSTELQESSYRLRLINGPVLAFETYNYIHLLNDPNPAVLNGTRGEGLKSDIEFDFQRATADSVFFKGRKYAGQMVLVRATQAEQESFLKGGYYEGIEKTKKFFVETPVSYFEIDNVRYQIFFNGVGKTIDIASFVDNKVISSPIQGFSFLLDGVEVPKGLPSGSSVVHSFIWEGEKLYAVTRTGEKTEVLASTEAIVPLNKTMGVKHASMRSPYLTYYPGSSDAGLAILKRYHEGLGNRATGYTFNSGYIDLKWDLVNNRITVSGFSSQNGGTSGWTTTAVYNYNFDEQTGQYKLTRRSAASGGYTTVILDKLDDFLLNSAFTIEYSFNSGNVYGKIKGVEKSDVEMTFKLL